MFSRRPVQWAALRVGRKQVTAVFPGGEAGIKVKEAECYLAGFSAGVYFERRIEEESQMRRLRGEIESDAERPAHKRRRFRDRYRFYRYPGLCIAPRASRRSWTGRLRQETTLYSLLRWSRHRKAPRRLPLTVFNQDALDPGSKAYFASDRG